MLPHLCIKPDFMDFLQKMITYYQNESGHNSLKVLASAVLLLFLGGFLSWKFAGPLSILKGLTIPLFIGGLFFGIAGAASGIHTKRTFVEKLKLYERDKTAFFTAEVPRVEKIHKSWFGIRLTWGLVAFSGLGLLLFAKRHYMMGVGLGILIFGLVGQIVEAFSFHRNEQYYKAVLEATQMNQPKQDIKPDQNKPVEPPGHVPSGKNEGNPKSNAKQSFPTSKLPGMKDGYFLNGTQFMLIHKAEFPDTLRTPIYSLPSDDTLHKDSLALD